MSFVVGVILTQSPCHAFVVLCVIIGGTSIDALLNCARSRLERDRNLRVPYGNIHECSRTMYIQCKSGQDRRCIDRLANASLMSYCAPLKDLPYFKWGTFRDNGKVGVTVPPSHGAITVLRHPVDRVWSMVRTYHCWIHHVAVDELSHNVRLWFDVVAYSLSSSHPPLPNSFDSRLGNASSACP